MRSITVIMATLSIAAGVHVRRVTEEHQSVLIGKSFSIKCEFTGLDSEDMIIWKRKGEEPLFMGGDAALSDDRYQINEDTEDTNGKRFSELTVNNVQTHEDGLFSCGTMDTDDYKPTRVKILVPPTAHISPEVWPYVVLIGEPVTLRCSISGNPQPKIHWSRQGSNIPTGASVEGDTIRFHSAQKTDSGIYVCSVNSTAGSDVSRVDMRVEAPHKLTPGEAAPWIKTEHKYVPVNMNGAVNLSCTYDGNPSPQIEWLFNGARLSLAKELVRNSIRQYAMRHDTYSESILEITEATADYFGDYSCRVSNQHGENKTAIYVTAYPSAPVLTLEGTILTITVQSPNQVDELALFHRRPNEDGWLERKLIGVTKADEAGDHTYSKHVNLLDYIDNGQYEVQVQARNSYSWGIKAIDMIRVDLPLKSDVPVASGYSTTLSSTVLASLVLILA